jgi:cobalt/nickel transport system permease protein
MSGLAIDDAAWRSAWRPRSPADKLLLSVGLVVSALVLPAWPGTLLVGLTAVVLALGPARVPVRTFGRAVRLPLAFISIGALTAVVEVGDGLGWAPDAAARAGALVGHGLAGSAALLLLATTTPMSDLLPELRRLRVPAAVVEVASLVYRLLFVLLSSLTTIREAQTARMGHSSIARSYRSSGVLAAAVLTRSWDRARRLQDGLAGRGMETGLRVLPEARPSSPAFVAATVAGLAALATATLAVA